MLKDILTDNCAIDMKSGIETYLQRENVWPDRFDETHIDELIWEKIRESATAGDFASYMVHRPQPARHMDEAKIRYESIDKRLNAGPICYFRAIEQIESLAKHGDAGAMFHMGKIYSIGIAVKQDFSAAERWYLQAMELGEVRAYCNLGWLYQSGFGVAEDKFKAYKLLSFGAEQGVPVAMATVGVMLLRGEGCTADAERGIQLLKEAFEGGYNNAANCIADAFFAGDSVQKDEDLAFEWLKRAVLRGDTRTMAILGHYLVTGSHGKQDVPRGVAYLYDAMNRGFSLACLWLGALYEHGHGVERNPNISRMLYERGKMLGDEECAFNLARLENASLAPTPGFHRAN